MARASAASLRLRLIKRRPVTGVLRGRVGGCTGLYRGIRLTGIGLWGRGVEAVVVVLYVYGAHITN